MYPRRGRLKRVRATAFVGKLPAVTMTAAGSAARRSRTSNATSPWQRRLERWRTPLLVLAGVRAVLAIAAIPLAPFLYEEHFVLLVLLRPTKEVLLAAGFAIKRGDADLLAVLAAAVPLAIVAVWHSYVLGRAYAKEIQSGEGLPRFADRVLPPKRIKQLCGALDERGKRMIFLGRLATFPSSLLGVAAGTSGMKGRQFFPADLAGALVGITEVLVAGYALGAAYRRAGPWLTAVGVAALLGMLFVLGHALKTGTRKRG
jgi:membrane protein DedA with SNARE-associated domain